MTQDTNFKHMSQLKNYVEMIFNLNHDSKTVHNRLFLINLRLPPLPHAMKLSEPQALWC